MSCWKYRPILRKPISFEILSYYGYFNVQLLCFAVFSADIFSLFVWRGKRSRVIRHHLRIVLSKSRRTLCIWSAPVFFLARCLRVRLEFRMMSGTLSCFRIVGIGGRPLNSRLLRVRTRRCTQNDFFSFASRLAFQTSRELRPRTLDTGSLPSFWSCGSRIYHKTPCLFTQLFPKNNDEGSLQYLSDSVRWRVC